MNAATKNKPASLGAGLVRKGEAAPAQALADAPTVDTPPVQSHAIELGHASSPASAGRAYHKALTVKLDKGRYTRLKLIGLETGKSSQQLIVEALDAMFRKTKL